MKRIEVLSEVVKVIDGETLLVSNVGNTAHQLHALRPSAWNLYEVNLGLCTAVSLGLALSLPHRKVVALDGDGNLLLNLSSLADVGTMQPKNLHIIVFDNGSYESGGGAPTATSRATDLAGVARSCGIAGAVEATKLEDFGKALERSLAEVGPKMIVARIELDNSPFTSDVPLTMDGKENKYRFVRALETSERKPRIPGRIGSKILLPEEMGEDGTP